jgi:tripartite-type tricarboxylate transporter receptor subunit TctC
MPPILLVVGMTLGTMLGAPALAQPPRPLTIVVPFDRGGGADFVAQRLAEAMAPILAEPVAVLHRPGEDGLLAADEVARAPADGRTLLLGSTASLVFAPLARGRMPLDAAEDYEPVALVSSVPRLILVHPSLDVKNLDQLIRLAREQPGKLPCGTSDQLSQHAARLFERQAGVRIECTHYPGGAALRDDLLAGRRKLAFESFLLPEVQAGQLQALAVAASNRMRAMPDVPTTSESGLPGVEAIAWSALLAPKGTDRARIEKLAKATGEALRQPAFVAALEGRGYVVRPMTTLQMKQYLQRDMSIWRRAS